MNDIVNAQFRDISTITTEIKMLQCQTERLVLEYAIEVGRRLCEAKELLPHGEWGKWLKEEVSFSQSTANNLMKIYDEYGTAQSCLFGATANSQALGNLSYTKALSLLAIPEDERESFAKEHDAENISTRELDRLIKEKQEADAEKDTAQRRLGDLEVQLDRTKKAKEKAESDLKAAKEKNKKLKESHETELKRLRENPGISKEVEEKLRVEAEAKAAETIKRAERELKEATEREEALRKQLQLAAPDTAVFKMLFAAVQEDYNKLTGCLLKIRSDFPETAEKLTVAIRAVLNKFMEAL